MKKHISLEAVHAQLCNALEMERCSYQIYTAALPLAPSPATYARWKAALDEAIRTEAAVEAILIDLGLDPARDSAQRRSVRCVGRSLLESMQRANSPAQRQRMAQECVRVADARDRCNWELLGQLLSIGADAPSRPAHAVRRRTTVHHDVRAIEWYRRAAGARCETHPMRGLAHG